MNKSQWLLAVAVLLICYCNPCEANAGRPNSDRTPSVGATNISNVIVDVVSPILKTPNNTKKLMFYLIEIPFLTTDLLANETLVKSAKTFYSKK